MFVATELGCAFLGGGCLTGSVTGQEERKVAGGNESGRRDELLEPAAFANSDLVIEVSANCSLSDRPSA